MIFSGQLTEQLKFYHIKETQSESGYKEVNEEYYMTRRAERLKGKEKYVIDAEELYHSNELTFRLRYEKVITETDVVVFRDERYMIISIDPYPRDREMKIIISKINE